MKHIRHRFRTSSDGNLLAGHIRREMGLSQNQARELVLKGKVHVDGVPCLEWNQTIQAGTEISVDTDRRAPSRQVKVDTRNILHQDPWLVVCNKPPGLVSVPPTRTGEPTFLDGIQELVRLESPNRSLVPLHRLDRETCGLIVFGVRGANLAGLRNQFAAHEVGRAYYAVVAGQPQDMTISGRIDVSRTAYTSRTKTVPAETGIRVIRALSDRALLECRPRTGRWHQIRIQLADAGFPIAGDRVHPGGSRPAAIRFHRLALQSWILEFVHPGTGRNVRWELPLDPDFQTLLSQAPTDDPDLPKERRF